MEKLYTYVYQSRTIFIRNMSVEGEVHTYLSHKSYRIWKFNSEIIVNIGTNLFNSEHVI